VESQSKFNKGPFLSSFIFHPFFFSFIPFVPWLVPSFFSLISFHFLYFTLFYIHLIFFPLSGFFTLIFLLTSPPPPPEGSLSMSFSQLQCALVFRQVWPISSCFN
jgi:hypothetical protein